jgi:hypothetical protein
VSRPTVDIDSDGKTVWVNDHTATCIGRFGYGGIDIHQSREEQLASGEQCLQCLQCEAGPTTRGHWERFKAGMLKHYGVTVTDIHMPHRLRGAIAEGVPA